MKILLVNDYLLFGGAEIYCLNLRDILEMNGHDVYIMCFDNNFDEHIKKVENSKNIYNIKSSNKFRMLNRMFFNLRIFLKIKRILKKVNPDRVIVNNIITSPITQIFALRKFKILKVEHDYGVICPKSTCRKDNGELCEGYKYSNCLKECTNYNSSIKMKLKLKLNIKVEKMRKKYFIKNIAPSEALNKGLLKYKYDSICINNPLKVENEFIKDYHNIQKNFLYVGNISENKGIFKFLESFESLKNVNDVNLYIIGKFLDEDSKEKMEKILKRNMNIEYLGVKNNFEVRKYMEKSYCLIVPSLWVENYPTTILEAQVSKLLVIGSNIGGIPELISDEKFVFRLGDTEDIKRCIDNVINLSVDEYKHIVEKNYIRFQQNNTYEKYYEKILTILR